MDNILCACAMVWPSSTISARMLLSSFHKSVTIGSLHVIAFVKYLCWSGPRFSTPSSTKCFGSVNGTRRRSHWQQKGSRSRDPVIAAINFSLAYFFHSLSVPRLDLCEGWILPGGKTPHHLAEAQAMFALALSTWMKEKTLNRSSWMTLEMTWRARADTWANVVWYTFCMRTVQEMTCEVFLFEHLIGYSGSPSTVDETNCNKKKDEVTSLKISWAPPTFGRFTPGIACGRVPSPVLQWKYWFCCNFLTWFRMKTVFERDCTSEIWSKSHRHFFCLTSMWDTLSLVSFEFLFRETVRVILLCQLVHLYALCSVQPVLSCDSRKTWTLIKRQWIPFSWSPWESTLLQHLFHAFHTFSILQFCRVEHHGDAHSWLRRAGQGEHPVIVFETFFWIRFQPRTVRKCSRSLLDSNREDILSIALSELFRMTRRTLHCPFHESLLLILHWMGCRCYFAASRLELLLDLLHEFANTEVFCFFHNCLWQTSLKSVLFLALREQTDGLSTLHKSPPCLFDLRLRFRLRLCRFLNVQQTLAHTTLHKSHRAYVGAFAAKQDIFFGFLSKQTRWLLTHGSPVPDNWIFGFGWIRWESLLLPATSESNSLIQFSWREIFRGGRSDAYTFSCIISPDSITTTFGVQ